MSGRFRIFLTILLAPWACAVADEIRPDFALDSDPLLTVPPPVRIFSEKHPPLWLAALDRPEADMQRLSAETIAQAHLDGVPKLRSASPRLAEIVAAEGSHPAARFAAARALVALDAKEHGAVLLAASQKHGADLRQLVEPALARWSQPQAGDVWRKRLVETNVRAADLMLAIRGLGAIRDEQSSGALVAIVHDSLRSPAPRLAAARAAGAINELGLEGDADKLAASSTILERLCAAAMLQRHQSAAAQKTLTRLAKDSEPSVAAEALARLNAIDHELVVPLTEAALANADFKVRREGVLAYAALPTPARVAAISKLLDDPHPGNRGLVRDELFRLEKMPELRDSVRAAGVSMLAGESWRGQEQAALLLGALDHEPAAQRLVELFESPRPEVLISAAWALRKLSVAQTLPAVLEKLHRLRESGGGSAGRDLQAAHLCELLGLMKYSAAEPLLRKFVPKSQTPGEMSRSSAIWALGHLHAGAVDEELAVQMTQRLTEPLSVIPPEFPRVRVACAISLGRMKAKSQVAPMRAFMGPKVQPVPYSVAIAWAIHEITGEVLAGPEPPRESRAGWFLEAMETP